MVAWASSGVVGGGRRLGQVEVTDQVVRHLGALMPGWRVGGDLESAVALERIGDDDLATERDRRGVSECALAGSRRPEERENGGVRQERRPRSADPSTSSTSDPVISTIANSPGQRCP